MKEKLFAHDCNLGKAETIKELFEDLVSKIESIGLRCTESYDSNQVVVTGHSLAINALMAVLDKNNDFVPKYQNLGNGRSLVATCSHSSKDVKFSYYSDSNYQIDEIEICALKSTARLKIFNVGTLLSSSHSINAFDFSLCEGNTLNEKLGVLWEAIQIMALKDEYKDEKIMIFAGENLIKSLVSTACQKKVPSIITFLTDKATHLASTSCTRCSGRSQEFDFSFDRSISPSEIRICISKKQDGYSYLADMVTLKIYNFDPEEI